MIALASMLLSGVSSAQAHPSSALASFIARDLKIRDYRWARADLNDDGEPEAVVYVTNANHCGSGGCDLFVLTPRGSTYRVVTKLAVTRPPIRMLTTRSHGWHDLSVFVAGGGTLRGHSMRLRFDGRGYPTNPTAPPVRVIAHPAGTLLIAP